MTEPTWPAELLAYIDGIRASFNSREEADDYLKKGLMKKWTLLDRAVAPPAINEAPLCLCRGDCADPGIRCRLCEPARQHDRGRLLPQMRRGWDGGGLR